MSAPAERLRRLYRQAGGQRIEPVEAARGASSILRANRAASAPSAIDPASPAFLCSDSAPPILNTLLRRIHREQGTALPARAGTASLPGTPIAAGLQLIQTFHRQPACAALQFDHAELGQVDTPRLLAIDTETTGLSGGSGTRAFLIGAADWQDGQLRVRQLLLTALGAEAAMLDAFVDWLMPRPVLLSYNGKCFDVPLLRTRLRLHRRSPKALDLAHVDLLYGVRRRYRGRWENCRLATAERELLDLARGNDLPGSEAPAAFRRWLREGDPEGITRAATHNAQDLISLVQLAIRLGGEQATPW